MIAASRSAAQFDRARSGVWGSRGGHHAVPAPNDYPWPIRTERFSASPVENPESPRTTFALTRLAENGADAAHIAGAIVSIWQEIAAALTPIIGLRGFAMLYKRSLFLTASHHPWLAGAHDSVPTVMDLSTLESVLAQQDSTESAVAGGTLLHTFHELLTSLVGPSLTETLLRSIWANAAPDSPTAQDTAP